jgi:hypothetical protein
MDRRRPQTANAAAIRQREETTRQQVKENLEKEKRRLTNPSYYTNNKLQHPSRAATRPQTADPTKAQPTKARPSTTDPTKAHQSIAPSKRQSTRNQEPIQEPQASQQQDENVGIYNFQEGTTVYCFSDIESNMPKEIKDLMFDENDKEEGIVYTPIDLESKNKAIVFTGDLIDRGAYTVRNLLNMLKLKETNKNNVILICGNREINKIRMYHECYIEEIDEMILKNGSNLITIESIIDLLDKDIGNDDCRLFKNSGCKIAASINIQGIVNPHKDYKKMNATDKTPEAKVVVPLKHRNKYDKNFKLSYSDDILRIKDMYANTLGSLNQIKFFNDEFNALFGNGTDLFGFTEIDFHDKEDDQFKEGIEEDPKYILLLKFIAMMNMVMGKKRKDTDLTNLPKCLQPYNGLYIKYLEKCHIISKFTIDGVEDNIYIASHSGIPYKKATAATEEVAATAGFFYIPDDVGIEPKIKPTDNNYIENIVNINNKFNGFIERILNDKVKYTDDDFKKYVAMGASCDNTAIEGLTSIASPIVSSAGIVKIRDESLNSLNSLNIDSAKKIYNIFGHQPSGFTPQINRVIDSSVSGDSGAVGLTSYHIDLDISKAEDAGGISNKKSSVYLTLNNTENRLVGKINTKAKYFNLEVLENLENPSLKKIKKTEDIKGINFEYDISLDDYCTNRVIEKISYGEDKTEPLYKDLSVHMFLVDDNYYGMFGFDLVKLPKSIYNPEGSIGKQGGKAARGSKKTYAKSAKRFINGKKQMVIYLGKRGGEYLKIKGEYMSLVKYIKIANKKKPTKK